MPKLRLLSATEMLRVAEKTTRPFTAISPVCGRSSPAMERSVVVLPQTEGPSRVKNRPLSTSKATSMAAFTGGPCAVLYSVLSAPTLSTSEILHAEAAAQKLSQD